VPGEFDVCWNCGTNREGDSDPRFQKEVDAVAELELSEQAQGSKPRTDEPFCMKCGSRKIIPHTTVLDQGQYSGGKLQVAVDGNPEALFFKDRLCVNLTATICGECGHVEWTAEHAEDLYEHYRQSRDCR
jgi:hypothetical protein